MEAVDNSEPIVVTNAEIAGQVFIGKGTVIHPFAKILANSGPIEIGENNVIEEFATIVNNSENQKMTIGGGNVFSMRSRSESLKIGDRNLIDVCAVVGPNVQLTNRCTIGANICLCTHETLPEGCVIFSKPENRISGSQLARVEELQLLRLQKLLPQYHLLTCSSNDLTCSRQFSIESIEMSKETI